ncbi:MAG: protein kinase [Labilithrix sp.]|nr:protein kinase [Labilithrix sp.]
MARQRRPGEHELAEGTRLLGRYSILDRIGSGGMATIYRATDDRLDRVVCIKLLRTTLIEGSGSDNTSGRAVYQATYSHFLKEALALSKLSHPNTLRIYDFGYLDRDAHAAGPSENGAPFHVSEYLDGGNLETHVRMRGAIPPEESLGILEAISGALAEAHEHNIIHRDIKPSNILFARVRGELVPKLADFGIAHSDLKKAGSAAGEEPVSTVALFSPRWAAPEQLCGSAEGARTDVYALGLVSVYMLTGKVLFGDDDVRVTFNDRVRSDAIVASRLAQIELAPEVRRVLTQSMLARPDDRIATAPELFEALRFALEVRPKSGVAPFRSSDALSAPSIVPSAPSLSGGSGAPSGPLPPASSPGTFPSAVAPLPPPPLPSSSRAIALSLEVEGGSSGARAHPAPERVAQYGERRVRYVQVHERLDLSFVDESGAPVRVRVTMLPGQSQKVNVKGLTCFVARPGQRPTPALSVSEDGTCELCTAHRTPLGELSWSFGQPAQGGRLFVVDGRQLLVPFSEGQQFLALLLGGGADLIVMCRR